MIHPYSAFVLYTGDRLSPYYEAIKNRLVDMMKREKKDKIIVNFSL